MKYMVGKSAGSIIIIKINWFAGEKSSDWLDILQLFCHYGSVLYFQFHNFYVAKDIHWVKHSL